MDHTSITVDKSEPTDDIVAVSCSRSFLVFVGVSEIYSLEMWRAAVTELVATATLMFSLTTSIISCLENKGPDHKFLVPTAVFINIFLFLTVTVPLSGGHMNPIFTLMATLKGATSPTRALIYIPAQCIGSVLGFITIKAVMSRDLARKYSLGGCVLDGTGPGPGLIVGLVLEFMCTFLVLLIVVTVAFDKRRCRELGLVVVCGVVATAVAVALFLSITVTGRAGYGGVGLNPARCLGAALVQGGSLWDGHWVFWVGPFLACVVYYGVSLNMPRNDSRCGSRVLIDP